MHIMSVVDVTSDTFVSHIHQTCSYLYDAGAACILPLFGPEALHQQQQQPLTLREAQQFAYCIELLPVVLSSLLVMQSKLDGIYRLNREREGGKDGKENKDKDIIHYIRQQTISYETSSSGGGGCNSRGVSAASSSSSETMAADRIVDLTESLFFADWGVNVLLPICNILCEIYQNLQENNLKELNTRLRKCYKSLQSNGDNISGVLHICVRLFDRRCVYTFKQHISITIYV